jgi:hypothetical protein
MNSTALATVMEAAGFTSIHFVNLSTAMKMCMNPPLAFLNGPTRYNPHVEKGHDEDITSLDPTILVTFDSKVKQFFIMGICNTFVELMLQHVFVQFHFTKYLLGSRKVLNTCGRNGGPNIFTGTKSKSSPCFPHKATTSLFTQGKKEIKSNMFLESLIQTAEQYQLVTAATTSYGICLGHISTC